MISVRVQLEADLGNRLIRFLSFLAVWSALHLAGHCSWLYNEREIRRKSALHAVLILYMLHEKLPSHVLVARLALDVVSVEEHHVVGHFGFWF